MTAKDALGGLVAAVNPQCRFDRALFLLGHMRCGSTALSNIICSRGDFSGYGEAHLAYDQGRSALGVLTVNQARRRTWLPTAPHLFDKILHNRYDAAACPDFFAARALFLVRGPAPTIASIRDLFGRLDSAEYASDAVAAAYYRERLNGLRRLWRRFSPGRRAALSYDAMIADPEAALVRVSNLLRLDPPLTNRYLAPPASIARGAGDPVASTRYDRIVSRPGPPPKPAALDLSPDELDDLQHLYRTVLDEFEAS